MQVLGERNSGSTPRSNPDTGGSAAGHPAASARRLPTLPVWGTRSSRRRGARVRGRSFLGRPKGRGGNLAVVTLPDPLLTVPMALADPITGPVADTIADPIGERPLEIAPGATDNPANSTTGNPADGTRPDDGQIEDEDV